MQNKKTTTRKLYNMKKCNLKGVQYQKSATQKKCDTKWMQQK